MPRKFLRIGSITVERLRIHVKGMVYSLGLARRFSWKWGAVEVRGVGDGATGLLGGSPCRGTKNDSVAARCSVPKSMQQPHSRGGATTAMNYWSGKIAISASDRRDNNAELEQTLKRTILFVDDRTVYRKSRTAGRFALDTGDGSLLRHRP